VRRLLAVALTLTAALSGSPAPAAAWTEHEFMVPMSDGVRLDVSLYVPDGAVQLPLIVRQHGGGSNKDSGYDVTYAKKYLETGNFAVLMYSHRGHGSSEGIFDFFGERTTLDLSQILDWISSPLSGLANAIDTDKVGTNGYSQGGGESLLPAMHDPRIKAVAVGQTFDDLNHALNPGDCFKFSFATGIFALAYKQSASKTDDLTAIRWGAQWDTDTEDVAIPYLDPDGQPGMISTTQDAASRSPATHIDDTTGFYDVGLHVPTFWSQSWEDSLFPADHGLGILANLEADDVLTHYWFASGGHETREQWQKDVDDKEAAMLEWFDEFLRGVQHGYESGAHPRVDYAQRIPIGGWQHKTATSWPVSADEARFDVVGGLTSADGILVREGSGGPQPRPVPIVNDVASLNVGTEPLLYYRAGGQRPEEWAKIPDGANRADTALFRSGLLNETIEMTGAPVFHLKYETTARAALQINAKLWDVAPDGTRTLVTRGCGSPAATGGTPAFDLSLWPNSHVFLEGHGLELTVSTTDFPTFKPDVEPSLTLILAGSTLTLRGVTQ
jgi:putative CocE/NonD family hydrolase